MCYLEQIKYVQLTLLAKNCLGEIQTKDSFSNIIEPIFKSLFHIFADKPLLMSLTNVLHICYENKGEVKWKPPANYTHILFTFF